MQAYPLPFGPGALAGARLIPLILVPGHLCGAWLYPAAALPEGFAVLPLADTAQDDRIDAMAEPTKDPFAPAQLGPITLPNRRKSAFRLTSPTPGIESNWLLIRPRSLR